MVGEVLDAQATKCLQGERRITHLRYCNNGIEFFFWIWGRQGASTCEIDIAIQVNGGSKLHCESVVRIEQGLFIKVEHGFYSLYSSKGEDTRYNQTSAKDQFLAELRRLVNIFRERVDQVSLTTTGHSLGAALAYLAAYDAVQEFPDLPVTVITFGGPRVGNNKFCDFVEQKKVKVLFKLNFISQIVPYTAPKDMHGSWISDCSF